MAGGHSHDHHHGHGHGHSHDHGHHHHAPTSFGRAFAIGIALNTVYVIVEAGYGLAIGSMALLADAGHNLSDILGLIIAWTGATLAKRAPSKRFTFGLRGSSILAALANAILLLVAVGLIASEAIQRIFYPAPVAGGTIIIVAAIASSRVGAIFWFVGSAMQVAFVVSTRVSWPSGEKGAVMMRSEKPLLPILATS